MSLSPSRVELGKSKDLPFPFQYIISTVLHKKGQSKILMKGQTDLIHSKALGKDGQSAGPNSINCSIREKKG